MNGFKSFQSNVCTVGKVILYAHTREIEHFNTLILIPKSGRNSFTKGRAYVYSAKMCQFCSRQCFRTKIHTNNYLNSYSILSQPFANCYRLQPSTSFAVTQLHSSSFVLICSNIAQFVSVQEQQPYHSRKRKRAIKFVM